MARLKPPKIRIEQDEETGFYVASWDDPKGGGITTQGETMEELATNLREALKCHFATDRQAPGEVALHFVSDPVLQLA